MPTWTHPWYLLLALGIPPLLWWWHHRRRNALRYSAVSLLDSLPSGRVRLVQIAAVWVRGLALLAIVIALAGPRWPDQQTRIPAEGIAIVMVVDCSGSMAELD